MLKDILREYTTQVKDKNLHICSLEIRKKLLCIPQLKVHPCTFWKIFNWETIHISKLYVSYTHTMAEAAFSTTFTSSTLSPIASTTITNSKRYVIILKCNPDTDITEDKSRSADRPLVRSLRKNAVTGAIWILDESKQKHNTVNNSDESSEIVVLTSTIARSFFIETPRSNIKEISDKEYGFLEAVAPEQRIGVLGKIHELVKIKIYDKITVVLPSPLPASLESKYQNQQQHLKMQHDCIVHYIGPLNASKGIYFGVVLEVSVVFNLNFYS